MGEYEWVVGAFEGDQGICVYTVCEEEQGGSEREGEFGQGLVEVFADKCQR